MITIEQLLESVDLDFEPRWVTKDPNGMVWLWETKPVPLKNGWGYSTIPSHTVGFIKLSEFDGKDWTECIYEVPRKTTGKIEPLKNRMNGSLIIPPMDNEVVEKINELVDAVNELKGAKNE